jgi:hypothetical protein
MDVEPRRFIPVDEFVRILKMAFLHARLKKIKKPIKWRIARLSK